MYHTRLFPILAILLPYFLPLTFAAIPIPKAPEAGSDTAVGESSAAPNVAEEGTSSTGGTSNPRLGTDEDTPAGTSSGSTTGEDTTGGYTGQTNNKNEDLGEVFQHVLDLIGNAIPNNDDSSATGAITPAPVPTSAVTDDNARACLQANNIYSSCSAQTSDFQINNNLPYQASCLCYWTSSGMVGWQPQTYDNLMSSCYNYVNSQQGQVTAASEVGDQSGLCTSVGDVRSSAAAPDASLSSALATPTGTAELIPSPTSGTIPRKVGASWCLAIGVFLSRILL